MDNAMDDILSRESFDDEDGMVSEDEEVSVDFFETAYVVAKIHACVCYSSDHRGLGLGRT